MYLVYISNGLINVKEFYIKIKISSNIRNTKPY